MYQQVPNILTVTRIISIPIICSSFYFEDKIFAHIFGACLFLFASLTDFLDGFFARKYRIETKFGMIFDPVADKLLVGCTLLMLVKFNKAELLPCSLIIARELAISGLREYAIREKLVIPVSNLGKFKTFIQLSAIFMLILGNKASSLYFIESFGTLLLWVAAIMGILSALQYTKFVLNNLYS